jgi:hypothetical protein
LISYGYEVNYFSTFLGEADIEFADLGSLTTTLEELSWLPLFIAASY